jgi:hypothetical protein
MQLLQGPLWNGDPEELRELFALNAGPPGQRPVGACENHARARRRLHR